ncbi:MAG: type II secretion system protein GspN [Leptospirillia bacterium]
MAVAKSGGKRIRVAGVLLYSLYAVMVFLVGMAVTFPVADVTGRVAALVKSHTGWQVDGVGPHWRPPASLYFSGMNIESPGGTGLGVRDLRLNAALGGLSDGNIQVDHGFGVYGGRVEGLLEATDMNTNEPGFRWKGTVDGLSLADMPLPPPGVPLAPWAEGVGFTGKASLSGQTAWRGEDAARGNGSANITLSELSVSLPKAPMGTLELPFGEVTGRLTWQRGRVDIADLSIQGSLVSGRGQGTVLVGRTPQTSRIDLRLIGAIEPNFPYRGFITSLLKSSGDEMTVTVKGTLARPMLYVNGKTINQIMAGG